MFWWLAIIAVILFVGVVVLYKIWYDSPSQVKKRDLEEWGLLLNWFMYSTKGSDDGSPDFH